MLHQPARATLFPYTTLFRSLVTGDAAFDAGSGDITLLDPVNDFAGTVSLTGDAVSIADSNKIGRAHSELQSRPHLVCRLLLEKKKIINTEFNTYLHHTLRRV